MLGQDLTAELQQQVATAIKNIKPLKIIGGGSKAFYGREILEAVDTLNVSPHQGIINYEPTELVVTARAGTFIQTINQALAEHNQHLPFEPAELSSAATLGGALACGLSGPARPYLGAIRDYVLGSHIINGKGEYLRLGGEVMKNVAGYDVSRLMVGAMGTLGVIMQASLKVLPSPKSTVTLQYELDNDKAMQLANDLVSRSLPVTASCYDGSQLCIRLSGSQSAIQSAAKSIGGESARDAASLWQSLREYSHPFFTTDKPIWRISLPALSELRFDAKTLWEWGGMQQWVQSDQPSEAIRDQVANAGGHATLFRNGDRQIEIFHPLTPTMQQLQNRIKYAFDPDGILNPGKLTQHY